MKCHRCGKREASIHVLEIDGGAKKSVWLCSTCALESEREEPFGEGPDADETAAPLDSLLGDIFTPAEREADLACPNCGTSLASFRKSNRLGCPRCYTVFRAQLLPLLARFHRHVSHVGRVPQGASGFASRLGEITRTRVALDKAIAVEDFEQAASLRDKLRNLERDRPTATEDPE